MKPSSETEGDHKPSIVLLFTRFPVASEVFLQREVRHFRAVGLPVRVVSLWGGDREWESIPVERPGIGGILLALLKLPVWSIRRPKAVGRLLGLLWRPRSSGCLNWAENLLGAAYALCHGGQLSRTRTTHVHAAWASAPAMGAYAVHLLTDIPFSIAAHAYDLFERGGDGWLLTKAATAQFVRTSTQAGHERLTELGVPKEKILLVRRGLNQLPPFSSRKQSQPPWRLLSVGRMVEKMGYHRQISLIGRLVRELPDLQVEWIGEGPLRPALEREVREAGLENVIRFRGRLPYGEVEKAYQRNVAFLFTGTIDRQGDRAGLPNAVVEAMAWGLVVFATDVGGVREAVTDGVTGRLWQGDPDPRSVVNLLQDEDKMSALRRAAREWVEQNYLLKRNLAPLDQRLSYVTFSP